MYWCYSRERLLNMVVKLYISPILFKPINIQCVQMNKRETKLMMLIRNKYFIARSFRSIFVYMAYSAGLSWRVID